MVIYVGTKFANLGVARSPATSQMELFVTVVNNFKLLTKVKKNCILDVARVLDRLL